MDKREEILNELNKIIEERNLPHYSLAKMTGINRSTLIKILNGSRKMNIRQFKKLVDVLPFSIQKKETLYNDFIECTWSKEQFARNNALLDIFDVLSNLSLENTTKFGGGG